MAITPTTIIFLVMSACVIGGGLGTVSSRNLVHAALYLILALSGISGLYILLEAPFLAAIQILVYVGAIAVLITITIMVTRRLMGVTEAINKQWPIAAVVGVLVFALLGFVLLNQFGGNTEPAGPVSTEYLTELGMLFASPTGFFVPFEVASVLLLAALIGSIVVARD
jgi:NADH-quinone oxidoreductase subunit J